MNWHQCYFISLFSYLHRITFASKLSNNEIIQRLRSLHDCPCPRRICAGLGMCKYMLRFIPVVNIIIYLIICIPLGLVHCQYYHQTPAAAAEADINSSISSLRGEGVGKQPNLLDKNKPIGLPLVGRCRHDALCPWLILLLYPFNNLYSFWSHALSISSSDSYNSRIWHGCQHQQPKRSR